MVNQLWCHLVPTHSSKHRPMRRCPALPDEREISPTLRIRCGASALAPRSRCTSTLDDGSWGASESLSPAVQLQQPFLHIQALPRSLLPKVPRFTLHGEVGRVAWPSSRWGRQHCRMVILAIDEQLLDSPCHTQPIEVTTADLFRTNPKSRNSFDATVTAQ
jgi:hypothetical protein